MSGTPRGQILDFQRNPKASKMTCPALEQTHSRAMKMHKTRTAFAFPSCRCGRHAARSPTPDDTQRVSKSCAEAQCQFCGPLMQGTENMFKRFEFTRKAPGSSRAS
uniref:Uncharacterized protein n=1 Tax=Noctiluca scintillans TaxID=2966 RepID=A0A7S1F3P9_NOCSC